MKNAVRLKFVEEISFKGEKDLKKLIEEKYVFGETIAPDTIFLIRKGDDNGKVTSCDVCVFDDFAPY